MADRLGGTINSPRVSVITIFLDEERFLGDAIESVLAQTYHDWELILCDDGSTDRSTAIARTYAGLYPGRVQYVEHPNHQNSGMSATRNLGLAAARGEFVAFLDGDDVWLPRKLERQVTLLDLHPQAGLVYGPSQWWYSWDPRQREADAPTRLGIHPGLVPGERVLERVLRHEDSPVPTCSVLLRRSAIDEVGGFEDRFTGLFEDQVFFAKILLTQNVLVTHEILDRYRQHPASSCAVAGRDGGPASIEMSEGRAAFVRWLWEYVRRRETSRRLRWLVWRKHWFHRYPSISRIVAVAKLRKDDSWGRGVEMAFEASRKLLPRPVRKAGWRIWRRLSRTPIGTNGDEE